MGSHRYKKEVITMAGGSGFGVSGGQPSYSTDNNSYYEEDPFDNLAASTIATIILFGSIIFATVGMAARAWLSGDKRGECYMLCVLRMYLLYPQRYA